MITRVFSHVDESNDMLEVTHVEGESVCAFKINDDGPWVNLTSTELSELAEFLGDVR